jgi:hypothetical protein
LGSNSSNLHDNSQAWPVEEAALAAALPANQLADRTHKLIDALIDQPGARIGLLEARIGMLEAFLGLKLGFGKLGVGFGKLRVGLGYHYKSAKKNS